MEVLQGRQITLVTRPAQEPVSVISRNGVCNVNIITPWDKVERLGSGSCGIVYRGISSEGSFFGVKEVLLEEGCMRRESIRQLTQEIYVLSQLEHENIVRYLGTETTDSAMYIFLELATEGSLAKLYKKYTLRDCHVSAYTRQILRGLEYLHDKKVVHR